MTPEIAPAPPPEWEPCQMSMWYGQSLVTISKFKLPAQARKWLKSVDGRASKADPNSGVAGNEVWTLPDGAYVRFALPANLDTLKCAAQNLAFHIAKSAALAEKNSAAASES